MAAQPAVPHYAVGERIVYRDHHDRLQTGAVKRIEAHWSDNGQPLIVYTCEHPTYRNDRMYVGADSIIGPAS